MWLAERIPRRSPRRDHKRRVKTGSAERIPEIDRGVDPRTVPSSLRFVPGFAGTHPPVPQLNRKGISVQGLSFELGLRY